MTKQERREYNRRLSEIYCGMLYGSRFEEGEHVPLFFRFDCPEFAELRRRYRLTEIAGKGGEFTRALRLCRYFAPNLVHEGDFSLTGDLPWNALALLDYSFGKKDHGLNCAGKAKILVECCLALGIYARCVGLYPNSPYDADNHVVAEVYDGRSRAWCMLDPTNGGYFSDGRPLSCLEMRERLSRFAECSVVLPRQNAKDIAALREKNADWNVYYAKNCFYFRVETVSEFGTNAAREAYLFPRGFDCHARETQNIAFLLERAREWGWEQSALDRLGRWADDVREQTPLVGTVSLWDPPVRGKP